MVSVSRWYFARGRGELNGWRKGAVGGGRLLEKGVNTHQVTGLEGGFRDEEDDGLAAVLQELLGIPTRRPGLGPGGGDHR